MSTDGIQITTSHFYTSVDEKEPTLTRPLTSSASKKMFPKPKDPKEKEKKKKSSKQKITVNIWDFAGQQVYVPLLSLDSISFLGIFSL